MIWKAIRAINTLIPKKQLILFYSIPDFSDNPFYLYKHSVVSGLCDSYECVWIVNTPEGKRRVENFGGEAVLRTNRLLLSKYLFRARFIVSSHGPPYWRSKNQVSIELYHGIPLKRLLRQFSNAVDRFIVPSEFVGVLFSANFQTPMSHFIPLGQPRCDALFTPKDQARTVLSQLLGIEPVEYEKLIIYLPTFRDYDHGATSRITLELINNEMFQQYLSKNNLLFLVKPHTRDEKVFEKYESSYIKIIKNEELLSRFLTLYDILPAVDVLVTDYSSVYFDYLLLNRPVVFYIPDLEKYRETRGFLLEPYEKWTPGDKARTPEELIVALEEAVNNPKKWERERLWLRDVMFKYQDGKASERIIKYFWGNV